MGHMAESSIHLRVALFLPPLASLLQLIGMASPNWISTSFYTSGLWKYCSSRNDTVCVIYPGLEWMKAVRAFEVLGFLGTLAACALLVFSVLIFDDSKKRLLKLLSLVASFVAGVLIIIGVVIYVAKIEEDPYADISACLSWACGLCITSAILLIICGVLVVLSLVM